MNNNKIIFWSITVAMAGFLFGFDTVVISGADLALQKLWPRGEFFHGVVIMGSALWGTVVGAIFAGYPTDKLGRKMTLIIIAWLYLVSAVGSAYAWSPEAFAFFRFIGGLGVGASTIAAPTYISEISPAHSRGRLVALYQFNIVLGILLAFLSNYALRDYGGIMGEPWRAMIGAEAIPALLYAAVVFFIPESPRWQIIYKNDVERAAQTLRIMDRQADMENLIAEIKEDGKSKTLNESIFDPKYRRPLLLAFLIAFFNQFSGINAFLYYAPRIFEIAGLEKSAALLGSIGIGIANLIFTMVGLALIDKLGRRQLMYIGSVGYIISLTLVSLAFFLDWQGVSVPVFLFIFISAHAIGQGSVIWVFISEIFPNHLRANGQAFGCSVHWLLAAIIPSLVPVLFSTIGAGTVFAVFAGMMVLQLVFVWGMMPETKGVSLEAMLSRLTGDKS